MVWTGLYPRPTACVSDSLASYTTTITTTITTTTKTAIT